MAEIQLARQPGVPLTDEERATFWRLMTRIVDGFGEQSRRAWLRFWKGLAKLEPGEMATVFTHRARVGWFHRKHMALEQRVFDAQERFTHFEQFRNWLKIGAGHVDWVPGPKGAVVPIPKSISYASLGQDEMEAFHDAVIDFLRNEPHAAQVLWPHIREPSVRDAGLAALLDEFDAFAQTAFREPAAKKGPREREAADRERRGDA